MKAPLNTAHAEGAIRCGCGSGSGPNTRVFIYLGTGAKGGDPPKNSNNKKHSLVFCSGGNHGGGPRGPCGVDPLTPNPDSNPVTNHCKNQLYRGHSLADALVGTARGNHALE